MCFCGKRGTLQTQAKPASPLGLAATSNNPASRPGRHRVHIGGYRPSLVQGKDRVLDKDQMDIERLDQRDRAERRLCTGCPDRLRQRCVTGRDRRRAMTMGYIGFTIFIAASGALIVWFWYRSYRAAKNARFGRACHTRNGLPDDPIPPFKRTISGLPEAELKRIEFEQKLDGWQRGFEVRKSQFNNTHQALQGTKYTFVPGPRRSNSAASSA